MSTAPSTCPVCDSTPLVGSSEILQGFCVKCGPGLLKRLSSLELSYAQQVAQNTQLQTQLGLARQAAQEQVDNFNAEQQGKEAARRHLDETENPYDIDKEEGKHAFWSFGWLHETSQIKLAETRAVMGWTLNLLGHVVEIAKGYGQEEIANKLSTIVEKLAPHIADMGEG